MSDIMVTIPKTRLKQVEQEEREVAEGLARGEKWTYHWDMGRLPAEIEKGDRVYFVWNGAVRAWHKVIEIEPPWTDNGCRLWLDPVIHKIEPVPMMGFRGFRYARTRTIFKNVAGAIIPSKSMNRQIRYQSIWEKPRLVIT